MTVNFKAESIQRHKDLANKIKEGLVATGNVVKEKEQRSSYISNLPEGIGEKEIDELSKYNSKFVTATHLAVGEVAASIFKDNKNIDQVEAEIGYFGKTDTININVSREKKYQNHLAKDSSDKEVIKSLVMQSTITSQSVKGHGLKSLRDAMSEEFEGMFKK